MIIIIVIIIIVITIIVAIIMIIVIIIVIIIIIIIILLLLIIAPRPAHDRRDWGRLQLQGAELEGRADPPSASAARATLPRASSQPLCQRTPPCQDPPESNNYPGAEIHRCRLFAGSFRPLSLLSIARPRRQRLGPMGNDPADSLGGRLHPGVG